MANLTSIEKLKLEKFLGMNSGYVLEFSNKTFSDFILENTGLEIFDSKYAYGSGSKANRLRALWKAESNYTVGKLILNILEHWKANKQINNSETLPEEQLLFDECRKIGEKLKQNSVADGINEMQFNDEKDFGLVAQSIRDSINKNEPALALDRLHTFVTKYMRRICDKHSLSYDNNIALHSLFGSYIKSLKEKGKIESEMTERILKYSISILESFNDVRNNKSLAHDNDKILNADESVLILDNIANLIRFIESIEKTNGGELPLIEKQKSVEINIDDIPF